MQYAPYSHTYPSHSSGLLQVLVLAIFFRKTTPTPLLEAAGLISAVIGLVFFLEGLRVAIMPMAMLVGTQLPQRLKLPWVLLVAFCLGVLVTYAEPAIAAIRYAVLCCPANLWWYGDHGTVTLALQHHLAVLSVALLPCWAAPVCSQGGCRFKRT